MLDYTASSAVKTDTTAILVDTDELQQDWHDGGGVYTFSGLKSTGPYFIRSFKDDVPNTFGVTDRDLEAS